MLLPMSRFDSRWLLVALVAVTSACTGSSEQAASAPASATPSASRSQVSVALVPKPTTTAYTPPPAPGVRPFTTQILSHDEMSAVPASIPLQVTNGWRGVLNKHEIVVYAGSLRSDPQRGAVLVEDLDSTAPSERRTAPGRPGALTIDTATNDGALTLRGGSGTRFRFSVPSRRFG